MIKLILGNVGCVDGDTLINVNRCKRGFTTKISHIYKMFHNDYNHKSKVWDLTKPTYVRSYNGKNIQLHKINDCVYSGVKFVYEIELINGLKLQATKEHKIMTKKGFIELQNLILKDEIMVDTLKPIRNNKKSYKLHDIMINGGFHPYKNKNNKVEVHRLIYESYLNNLQFIDFLDIIWNDKKSSKKLKFVNPFKYHIHHIDKNHYNNDIKNLKLMDKKIHLWTHGTAENFNQGVPKYSKIKSIKEIGFKKTYDIVCEEPYHNFVANGIVIHNSGKTAQMVMFMKNNPHINFMTNIKVFPKTKFKHVEYLKPEMVIHKNIISHKKDGSPVYEYKLNVDFWKKYITKTKNLIIIIDEAHTFFNPRRSMSKINIIMTDFLALLRRVLGSSDNNGQLFLLTQLSRRLDVIAKEMATDINFNVLHYNIKCKRCGYTIQETNETPFGSKMLKCFNCGYPYTTKFNFVIETWCFKNIDSFMMFYNMGMKSYYNRYLLHKINTIFNNYDTFQWDDLMSDY